MCESIVVVGAALSADVDAPTERVHSAPGARRGQSPTQPAGERAGRENTEECRVKSHGASGHSPVANGEFSVRQDVRGHFAFDGVYLLGVGIELWRAEAPYARVGRRLSAGASVLATAVRTAHTIVSSVLIRTDSSWGPPMTRLC
jgi:hypothetical protein